MPACRAKEDLRAAILVEEDRTRAELLGLCGEEVEHDGLARSGRPDDREVAEIAFVEVEEVGRRAGRLEDRTRIAPMVACGLADGKTVQRDKAGGIGR